MGVSPDLKNQPLSLSMVNKTILNAFSIDVEDYYMVSAFADVVKFEDWHNYESRVERNTKRILEILDFYDVKATFFILGWVAEHHPKLVKEIHNANHEVASHSYNHRLAYNLTFKEFRDDVRKSKEIIENIIGERIIGYRAPSYSIIKDSLWVLDILVEEGFLYDSSIFPILHDRYGIPDGDRFPHEISRPPGVIKEFPMSTLQVKISSIKYRIPIAGGGYLRLFPEWLIRSSINYVNNNEGQPVVIYLHPWEIDHEQPRIKVGFKSRFRHYVNLGKTVKKVKNLLSSFNFAPIRKVLELDNKKVS